MHSARLEGWVEERKCKPLGVRGRIGRWEHCGWGGEKDLLDSRTVRTQGGGGVAGKKCLRGRMNAGILGSVDAQIPRMPEEWVPGEGSSLKAEKVN